MEQPAKPISSTHGPRFAARKRHGLADGVWGVEVQGAVWALPVVVVDIGAKHPFELPAREDQDQIEALVADRAYPALGICIGVRSPNRSPDHAGIF